MFGAVQTGRIDKNQLGIFERENAELTSARGLRARGDSGDLLPKQGIEQGGLAYIGASDDGDKAGTMGHAGLGLQLAMTRLRMMRTAPVTICQVSCSLRKMTPSVTPPSGKR